MQLRPNGSKAPNGYPNVFDSQGGKGPQSSFSLNNLGPRQQGQFGPRGQFGPQYSSNIPRSSFASNEFGSRSQGPNGPQGSFGPQFSQNSSLWF